MPRKFPIATNAAPPSMGTHTQAIRVGDFVYTGSQTGRNPNTGKLVDGLEAQTRQMLNNLDVILNAAGCSRADIIRVNLSFTDLKYFKPVDQIYAEWIPDRSESNSPLPTRTALVAAGLPAGALVMMDVIAACPSPPPQSRVLSSLQLNQYDRDGIVYPVTALSPQAAATYHEALDTLIERHLGGSHKGVINLHLAFHWAYRLVTTPVILDAVEDLLGKDILVYGSLILGKPPQDSSYASWHQDSVYSQWHLSPSVSAWVALTRSSLENGCLQVIPGSHKQGMLNHETIDDRDNLIRRGENLRSKVDESQAMNIELFPGQMSLHHCNVIHGSQANTSKDWRIGFIIRYVTPEVVQRDRTYLRVRGHADCSHLNLAEPPTEMDDESAVAIWRKSVPPA